MTDRNAGQEMDEGDGVGDVDFLGSEALPSPIVVMIERQGNRTDPEPGQRQSRCLAGPSIHQFPLVRQPRLPRALYLTLGDGDQPGAEAPDRIP